jgi:hypothetical protein
MGITRFFPMSIDALLGVVVVLLVVGLGLGCFLRSAPDDDTGPGTDGP